MPWEEASAEEIIADIYAMKDHIRELPPDLWHLRPPKEFEHDCPYCYDPQRGV